MFFKEIVGAISFFFRLRAVCGFHWLRSLVPEYYFRYIFTTLRVYVESSARYLGVISYLIGEVMLRNLRTSSRGSSSKVARKEYFSRSSSMISTLTLYQRSIRLATSDIESLLKTSFPSVQEEYFDGSVVLLVTRPFS